jgi:hypothetical protein
VTSSTQPEIAHTSFAPADPQELARQRLEAVSFDPLLLADFGERVLWSGPVTAHTPLVREQVRGGTSDE